MNSSSENQSKKSTSPVLKRKHISHFSVINPIIEIPEDHFSSIEEIRALLKNILNDYDVKPNVCSENDDDELKNRWTLFEIKTSENMGHWYLTYMKCSISLLKINGHYLIDAHRISGDSRHYSNFLNHLINKISGEEIPQRTKPLFVPPDFCSPYPATQSLIDAYQSLVATMTSLHQPLEMIDAIITMMMDGLIKIRSKATPTELIEIDEIVDSVITTLVDFINDDVQNIPFIVDPSRQNEASLSKTAIRTQIAIQSIYILSQNSYYFDKLKHFPNLQNKLKTLNQYQPPHPEDHYLCAEMKRTCSRIMRRLDHYKDSLQFFFAKIATTPVLPPGLCMRYVPKDGHCLYHAIRIHLPDHPRVEDLRTQVANYVVTNRERYEHHIAGSFDAYVAGIRSNAWGDQIEIDALMHLFQRSIIIFHDNGSPATELHQGVFQAEPIPVLFDDINHYNAVTLSTNLPMTMRQAIIETPKQLISQVQDLNKIIGSFLTTPELEHFLGGKGHCEAYFSDQDDHLAPGLRHG